MSRNRRHPGLVLGNGALRLVSRVRGVILACVCGGFGPFGGVRANARKLEQAITLEHPEQNDQGHRDRSKDRIQAHVAPLQDATRFTCVIRAVLWNTKAELSSLD